MAYFYNCTNINCKFYGFSPVWNIKESLNLITLTLYITALIEFRNVEHKSQNIQENGRQIIQHKNYSLYTN